MARNGSGEFSLVGADFTNGTLADADEVMAKLDDIATALTGSIAKDGQTVPTAALPMGTYNHTNVGVATARTQYARASQIADGALVYAGVAGGTADAITLALSPAITAYVKGMSIDAVSGSSANTGAVTAIVNSVGTPGAVTWPDGTALVAGDIPANAAFRLTVAATTPVFHLQTATRALSFLPLAGGTVTGPITLPGNGTAALHAVPKQQMEAGDRQRIWGLTYANAADATNDITVAIGGASDSTGADWLLLAAALTKQLDVAWAVGDAAGGRTGASIADTDYNIWLIKRVDTGVVDVCLEQVAQATPTLPPDYTLYRKIGWFKRVSGTIVAFSTAETAGGGVELLWSVPTLDVDLTDTLTTSRRTDAAKVPLNFSTTALVRTAMFDASSTVIGIVCSPDETDAAPSITAAPLATHAAGANVTAITEQRIKTSAAGLIAARATLATVDTYRVVTLGFQWSRK